MFWNSNCNIGWPLFPNGYYRKLGCVFHAWVLFCVLTAQMFFMPVKNMFFMVVETPQCRPAAVPKPCGQWGTAECPHHRPGWWFVSRSVWGASWSHELFCVTAVTLGTFLFTLQGVQDHLFNEVKRIRRVAEVRTLVHLWVMPWAVLVQKGQNRMKSWGSSWEEHRAQ